MRVRVRRSGEGGEAAGVGGGGEEASAGVERKQGGGQGDPRGGEGGGRYLVVLDAEGARGVGGVLRVAARSCRHTPLHAAIVASALRSHPPFLSRACLWL
eukprot:491665-Rhodomonas_salina.1